MNGKIFVFCALILLLATGEIGADCSNSTTGCLDCVEASPGYKCGRVKRAAHCVCSDNNNGSCIAGGGSCDYTGPTCGKPFCPDVRGPATATALPLEELSVALEVAETMISREQISEEPTQIGPEGAAVEGSMTVQREQSSNASPRQ